MAGRGSSDPCCEVAGAENHQRAEVVRGRRPGSRRGPLGPAHRQQVAESPAEYGEATTVAHDAGPPQRAGGGTNAGAAMDADTDHRDTDPGGDRRTGLVASHSQKGEFCRVGPGSVPRAA